MRPPTNTREVSGSLSSRAHVLNKEFLLSHCYINDPSDLSVANISGADLDHVSLVFGLWIIDHDEVIEHSTGTGGYLSAVCVWRPSTV